jgi:hypothetical protein
MTRPESSPANVPPQRVYSPLAGVLSYLVPGLGQIYQGRVTKGVLFLVCLYTLFFFGLYLGDWQNVYIQAAPASEFERGGQVQHPQDRPAPRAGRGYLLDLVLKRAPFFGQMWIGVAAWPAVWQYLSYNPAVDRHPVLGKLQRMPSEEERNEVLRDSDKTPDLGWMYTVIAGVLNVLVIYDAFAGPAFLAASARPAEAAHAEQEVALP